jgi:hypothetical protein
LAYPPRVHDSAVAIGEVNLIACVGHLNLDMHAAAILGFNEGAGNMSMANEAKRGRKFLEVGRTLVFDDQILPDGIAGTAVSQGEIFGFKLGRKLAEKGDYIVPQPVACPLRSFAGFAVEGGKIEFAEGRPVMIAGEAS